VQSHSGCTRTQSLAGANKRHQVVEEGRGVVVERGTELGAGPSDTGSVFCLVAYTARSRVNSDRRFPCHPENDKLPIDQGVL
jgi:hypothetical protein